MKRRPLISLLLLVPAPSIGVVFGMILMPGTAIGRGVFLLAKIWILLLPAGWYILIERQRVPRAKTEPGGFRAGMISGLAISGLIVLMYLLSGRYLTDPEVVRGMAREIGLAEPKHYLAGALYWIGFNSILEEYVWRWFVVRQCAKAMPRHMAIPASALAFTLHHILALQCYFTWPVTVLCALGIVFGGALWSWMFLRYKTIWPGWLSHALVDITVFALGYLLIFG